MAIWTAGSMVIHLTFVQTLHGQTIQNGFYFTNKNSWDTTANGHETKLKSLIARFILSIVPKFALIQNNQVAYRTVIGTVLYPKDGAQAETIFESGGGAQPNESLPSYVSGVLTLRSGYGGKSNRGRLYVGGIGEDNHTASRVDAYTLTALQNLGDELLTSFGPVGTFSGNSYVIYSRKLGLSEGGLYLPIGCIPVTATQARSVLGTQRHRMIGIGT